MNENLKHITRNTIYTEAGFSVSQMEGNTWMFTEAGLRGALPVNLKMMRTDEDYYYSGNFEKPYVHMVIIHWP